MLDDVYVPRREVCRRYHKTDRTIDRWIKNPPNGFPSPIKIGGQHLWRVEELEGWERSLTAGRIKEIAPAA